MDGDRFQELEDLFGKKGSEEMRKRACEQLEEAIGLIPDSDKEAYCQAKRTIPDLVEDESPKELFLRHEDYNVWRAARGLVSYWTWRAKLFGSRAFLPLLLAGESALSDRDRACFDKRRYEILPDTFSGYPVLHFNMSVSTPDSSFEYHRCLFYVVKVLCRHAQAAKGIHVIVSTSGAEFKPLMQHDSLVELLSVALPIRFGEVHVVPENGEHKAAMFEKIVPSFFNFFGSRLETRIKIHKDKNKKSLIDSLRSAGFTEEGIPETIGGGWKPSSFCQWKASRTAIESKHPGEKCVRALYGIFVPHILRNSNTKRLCSI